MIALDRTALPRFRPLFSCAARAAAAAARDERPEIPTMSSSEEDVPLSALRRKKSKVISYAEPEDNDEDFEPEDSPPAKAPKKTGKPVKRKRVAESKAKKAPAKKAKKAAAPRKERASKPKFLTKGDRILAAMKAFKWWEYPDHPDGIQWRSLEHAGVSFPPPYVPHGLPLHYDGQEVSLTPAQEEIATWYAEMPLDGPQLGDATWAPKFQENFFGDFRNALGKGHAIKRFDKCDWTGLRNFVTSRRLAKRSATDAEKAATKAEKMRTQATYGIALVDGHLEKVGNFTIELPGLFRGRGKHPKTGKVKTRVMPEQITLNFGEDAPAPICPIPGHAWGVVQHDASVTWLANWRENIMDSNKYVMLAAMSSLKGKSDRDKYGKAIKLMSYIGRIRADYRRNMTSSSVADRQLATAMWFIDILALRVGGEKGEDEADTVGCTSLRVEHFTFDEDSSVKAADLEFLGKDSMRFKQNINFEQYGEVGGQVFQNIKRFCRGKKPSVDVFDTLNPSIVNSHLQSIMPGLTAKVFRTYNASVTLQNELPTVEAMRGLTPQEMIVAYNDANRKVAILCNHQKTVSNAQQEGLDKLAGKLAKLKQQRKELTAMKKLVRAGNAGKVRLASDVALVQKAEKAKARAEKLRNQAKTTEQRIEATKAMDHFKELRKEAADAKYEQAHLFKRVPDETAIENRVRLWGEKIRKMEVQLRNKNDNKEVALGTSKINYMDPRISVAWCKRVELPIERVFARALRDKFNWAMAVPPTWRFDPAQT